MLMLSFCFILKMLLSLPNVDLFPYPQMNENFKEYPVSILCAVISPDECADGEYSVIALHLDR